MKQIIREVAVNQSNHSLKMSTLSFHKLVVNFLILFVVFFSNLSSSENSVDAKSREEIIHVLQKWPQDFNSKNIEATCGLFAQDLIASYPGTTDRNYEEMCSFLEVALKDPNKTFAYEAPNIEQIIIQGDMAVVRLVWILKISHKNQSTVESVREKGLDIFKRQKDGTWKIVISYAYPEN